MTRKFKLKAPEDRSGKRIQMRVSEANYIEIEKRAKSNNLSMTDYMVRTALGRQIRTNNANIIHKLMEIIKLQKEHFKTDRRNEHQYLRVMQASVDTINKIPLMIGNKESSAKG